MSTQALVATAGVNSSRSQPPRHECRPGLVHSLLPKVRNPPIADIQNDSSSKQDAVLPPLHFIELSEDIRVVDLVVRMQITHDRLWSCPRVNPRTGAFSVPRARLFAPPDQSLKFPESRTRWLNAPWRDTISGGSLIPFGGDECVSFRGVDLTAHAMPSQSLMTARALQVMNRLRLMRIPCALPEHPSRGVLGFVHVGVMAA